jgi:transposase
VATVFEVCDEIWEVVEPMIPPVKVPERQGRRPVADRVCFEAIAFVMITGIAWGHRPSELGCSGVTGWRRLREWHHLIVDPSGIPLAATLTSGNRNDVTQLLPLVDGVGPIRGKPGRPRQRPDSLIADRGYDHDNYRRELWARGVEPIIARRATEHGSGLGRMRWVVERTFAWLHQFRRLRIRWERRPELHQAFMHLACAFICQRFLRAL